MKTINKEIFNLIYSGLRKDIEEDPYIDVDTGEIIYSYLNSTEDTFHILHDWNEYIPEEKKQIDIILKYVTKIKEYYENN